jgi:hypothetical protein
MNIAQATITAVSRVRPLVRSRIGGAGPDGSLIEPWSLASPIADDHRIIVHLAHEVGEVAERSNAGEGRAAPITGQRALSVIYKGNHLDCGYRIDILVERKLIIEVKSVDHPSRIH